MDDLRLSQTILLFSSVNVEDKGTVCRVWVSADNFPFRRSRLL